MIRTVFTCGDINGIGPEIAIKTFSKIFQKKNANQIIFICPKNVFDFYYKLTKSQFQFKVSANNSFSNSLLNLIPLPNVKMELGNPTKDSGKVSFDSINKAINLIQSNKADVLVTAPISKESFKLARINFPGHTELLAKSENSKDFMMIFLSGKIKAGLLTIHSPISKVADLISKEKIVNALNTISITAKNDLGILNPKIAVLGLNPHAGENGLIGKEEKKIIEPAIKSLKGKINVSGPFVPDAFWGNKLYKKYDLVLGMYHDQILIPFKLLNFNIGVNFTAGLNLIRTSPDHGTAFDIAGKNIANISSTMEAYKYAVKIYYNRKKFLAKTKLY